MSPLKFALSAIAAIIILRLFQLQIIGYENALEFTKSRKTVVLVKQPKRGTIKDRNGKVLAINEMLYDVHFDTLNDQEHLTFFENIARSHKVIKTGDSYSIKSLTFDDITTFELKYMEHNCYTIKARSTRNYPYKTSAGNLIGFCNRLSNKEGREFINKRIGSLSDGDFLERETSFADLSNMLKGRSGIESYFNEELMGQSGITVIEKDTTTGKEKSVDLLEVIDGKDIRLTIDIELQKSIESAAIQYSQPVAACVLKTNGEIVALVSTPSINPNDFIPPTNNEKIKNYLNDNHGRPLVNKCISSAYPPASVFKLLVAACALNENQINSDTHIECTGTYKNKRDAFRCWVYRQYGKTHGDIDLNYATATSCNIYFFEIVRNIGADRFISWIKKFNFGSTTNIELPNEKSGTIPHDKINADELLSLGIGQGPILTTPLQIASFINTIANKGSYYKPVLIPDTVQKQPENTNISPKVFEKIIDAMRDSVRKSYGTAHNEYLASIGFAGKTGSAELGNNKISHAWFAGLYPWNKPKYIVVVFAEHGGGGGDIPLKICEEICFFLER
ncbi:MAG: hypothetical protein HY606_03395 [Planctomycetes bacterium]|nr:hypothetical protein [Planctomycetota bacterium]